MPSRKITFWTRVLGVFSFLLSRKPKLQDTPNSSGEQPARGTRSDRPSLSTRVSSPIATSAVSAKSNAERDSLSKRLIHIADANTPKARTKQRKPLRSTTARPAPLKRAPLTIKNRDQGPVTWAAYKGRTLSASSKRFNTPRPSAQVIKLHKPSQHSAYHAHIKRNTPVKESNLGFARAA